MDFHLKPNVIQKNDWWIHNQCHEISKRNFQNFLH